MNRLLAKNIESPQRVIVIAAAPNIHRQYYDTPFEEGVKKTPTCFSSDGKTPDYDVDEPQATFCIKCPKNIQGSGEGNSKACKMHQKIAVSLQDNLKGPVYQLVVSSTSLFNKSNVFEDMGFLQYVRRLYQQGQSVDGVVTEIDKIDENNFYRISFKPIRHLKRHEIDYVQQRANSEEVDECLTFNMPMDLLEQKHFFKLRKKMGVEVKL